MVLRETPGRPRGFFLVVPCVVVVFMHSHTFFLFFFQGYEDGLASDPEGE